MEDCSELTFGGRGDDFLQILAGDVHGSIRAGDKSVGVALAEEMESGPAGAGLGFGQVGTIRFDGEGHVTGAEGNNGIGMGGGILFSSPPRQIHGYHL